MMKRLAKMAVMAIAGSVMFFNGNVIAEEIEAENAAGCVEEAEEDEESEKIEEFIEKELHEIEEAEEEKAPAAEEEESFEEETFEEEYFEEETFEEEYFEEETFEENFEEEEEFITIEDYDTPLGLGYTQEEMEEAAREQQEAQEKKINQENMKVTIYTSRQDSTLPGEQITLSSQIEGFEDVSGMAYQWMADKGDGFEPVAGANENSYTFTADEENMGWNWRLMVYFC